MVDTHVKAPRTTVKSKTPQNDATYKGGRRAKKVKTVTSYSDRVKLSRSINLIIDSLVIYFGFDKKGYSTLGTLDHWDSCAQECGGFIPFMKYKIAAFYAACHTEFLDDPQEVPPRPFQREDIAHVLLGGRGYTFTRSLFKSQPRKIMHSWMTTILQLKKGLDRPGEDMLRKSMKDTFIALTTPAVQVQDCSLQPDWYLLSEVKDQDIRDKYDLNHSLIVSEIERTVNEIFGGHEYKQEDEFGMFFPSTSANYINSRGKGGALGVIMKDPTLLKGLSRVGQGSLLVIEEEPMSGVKIEDAGFEDVVFDEKGGMVKLNDEKFVQFQEEWKELCLRIRQRANDEQPIAVPLALAEALKVRVITKGPPFLNTTLKNLQKFLWRVLKSHKVFKLVGQWITLDYLASCLGGKLNPDQYWLSVDYKDATNKLNSKYSDVCCDAISRCCGLSDETARLFKRALTGHLIQNPDDINDIRPQSNGQLMGSIVSFPVLCVINASILRLVRELDVARKLTLNQSGVIVNGDDGLLKATRFGYECWKKIGTFVGLSPSVGKVYLSKKFFNINSTTYEYSVEPLYEHTRENGKKLNIHFELCEYVNYGLLNDMSRSTNDATNSTLAVTSIGERCNELMRTCPPHLKEAILTKYMSKHLELLTSLNVPWYIPESLGGLGIPILPGTRHVPSDKSLRIAKKVYDFGVKLPKLRPTDSWRTWKVAMKQFPANRFRVDQVLMSAARVTSSGDFGLHPDQQTIQNVSLWSMQSLRNLYVVETVFNNTFEELYSDVSVNKHTIEMNYYRKLARANDLVMREHEITGVPLSKVQPFDMLHFPSPSINVDDVPFVKSARPHNEYAMQRLLDDDDLLMFMDDGVLNVRRKERMGG